MSFLMPGNVLARFPDLATAFDVLPEGSGFPAEHQYVVGQATYGHPSGLIQTREVCRACPASPGFA